MHVFPNGTQYRSSYDVEYNVDWLIVFLWTTLRRSHGFIVSIWFEWVHHRGKNVYLTIPWSSETGKQCHYLIISNISTFSRPRPKSWGPSGQWGCPHWIIQLASFTSERGGSSSSGKYKKIYFTIFMVILCIIITFTHVIICTILYTMKHSKYVMVNATTPLLNSIWYKRPELTRWQAYTHTVYNLCRKSLRPSERGPIEMYLLCCSKRGLIGGWWVRVRDRWVGGWMWQRGYQCNV